MENRLTTTFIKPESVKKGNTIDILNLINKNGFQVKALKMFLMSRAEAQQFYAEHVSKPFYNELIDYIISGPIVALILEKENAVEDLRKLMGSTDPKNAKKGTIRNLFGFSLTSNGIHGSDSDKSAIREMNILFHKSEIF